MEKTTAVLTRLVRFWFVYTVMTAGLLSFLLIWLNRPVGVGGAAELVIAMAWLCGCLGALQVAGLGIAGLLIGRLAGWSAKRWTAFMVSSLVAVNLVWVLVNWLTEAQWWLRAVTAITWPGLIQTVILAATLILIPVGGVLLSGSDKRRGAVCFGAAALLVAGCLAWNAFLRKSDERSYSLAAIRAAAESRVAEGGTATAGAVRNITAEAAAESEEGDGRVIILGFDGLSWDMMKPLLEAGKLPNFAALIADGSIGYLDNGSRSYSPEIWNSIFSGMTTDEHTISEFHNLYLPRFGAVFSRLLIMPPTPHSLFGTRHLLAMVPNPGLWEMHSVRSTDRAVKVIWEIASDFDRRVLVVDPITSLPVQPVNGKMLVRRTREQPYLAYPPTLDREWREYSSHRAQAKGYWAAYAENPRELLDRAPLERDFTLELFERSEFDLGVYFAAIADSVSHVGWNFYSPERRFLWRLPRDLSDEEWEELVLDKIDAVVPGAYLHLDETVGRFLEMYGRANYIVVSDHGWSYSGLEYSASQDGVVVFSGPAFQRGLGLDGVRVEDITPTAVELLGIPRSLEFSGRVVGEVLREAADSPVVKSYGSPRFTRGIEQRGIDEEELERLKALGYLK